MGRRPDKHTGFKVCTSPTCKAAGKPQPLENFNIHTSGAQGRASKCRPCLSAYYRKRGQERVMPSAVATINEIIAWPAPGNKL